jgi:hypothetical protein
MTTESRLTLARSLAAVAALVLFAPAAGAQSTVTDTVRFLMTNQSVATGSVARDQAAADAASGTLARALLANLATLPVTSSTGSFTYRLNPELGTVERADRTFGPFFVERALTVGRNQFSAGITIQHLDLTSIDGRSLTDGSLVTTANQFTDETAPFDVDRLRLDITADVATLYGAYGITDRLDVAAALPLVSLRISGSRVNTYRGRAFEQAKASATAVGAADAVLRVKYLWAERGGARFATAADVRLPTGREQDLLGAGSASIRLSGLGSLDRGSWSAHANVGASAGGFARELTYGGAFAVAAGTRLTLSGEVLGRLSDGVGALTTTTAPHPLLADVETIRLSADRSWRNAVSVVPGLKWNVTSTWVLLANVAVPVTNAGLTAPATPFVGLDYAFGSIF